MYLKKSFRVVDKLKNSNVAIIKVIFIMAIQNKDLPGKVSAP